jgi:hypothetical protein
MCGFGPASSSALPLVGASYMQETAMKMNEKRVRTRGDRDSALVHDKIEL